MNNKTEYFIYQEPTYIGFTCPACGNNMRIDWDDVLADDEYCKWGGDIDPIECDSCKTMIEFDGCDFD